MPTNTDINKALFIYFYLNLDEHARGASSWVKGVDQDWDLTECNKNVMQTRGLYFHVETRECLDIKLVGQINTLLLNFISFHWRHADSSGTSTSEVFL